MNDTDYGAREAFLRATTHQIEPAPIDALLELLPKFQAWRGRYFKVSIELVDGRESRTESAYTGAAGELHIGFAMTTYRISPFDTSAEAGDLRNAVSTWADRYRFIDDWVSAAAVSTLFIADRRGPQERQWYFLPDKDLNPRLPPIDLSVRGFESNPAYEDRCFKALRERIKERRRLSRFRTGALAQQEPGATWTARMFAGFTYAEIARAENQTRNYVRKIVTNFVGRAGLTLPTLGETIPLTQGKAGKSRARAGNRN